MSYKSPAIRDLSALAEELKNPTKGQIQNAILLLLSMNNLQAKQPAQLICRKIFRMY